VGGRTLTSCGWPAGFGRICTVTATASRQNARPREPTAGPVDRQERRVLPLVRRLLGGYGRGLGRGDRGFRHRVELLLGRRLTDGCRLFQTVVKRRELLAEGRILAA